MSSYLMEPFLIASTTVPTSYHCHQTAEGLAYLHTSAVPQIYHRDVKSSNILLGHKLDAKVADFGLSRLAVCETSHITTCAQGTLCCLDPEYYLNFQLTDKSDEKEDANLAVYVKKILREERLMEAVDPELKEEGSANKVELKTIKALGSLAAACLDERRQNRSSMKHVADEIEYIISIVDQNAGVS
ncbi:Serine/threonine protein kinase [Trema orientale]|uniref:Serine/threonine protein kinase n=1 Tax=Trema orientale TaxID=63057 RepID=A0A2P5EZ50_TREOI|nr:Serine/threonine protein kinase [Trema orientale]